ncbi:MAG TPA: secondary thiamine-phosphate synthase enzyme YjbQ, partial [candidate division Zixibacteria bacterium]|nr:secondary thiamine-phosphate synthase enzyme YjbQ [candidate division Zixibacteria bacterium]
MRTFSVKTTSRNQMVDILTAAQAALDELITEAGKRSGAVVVYCPHTTAAITVNEDYDPDVKRDILHKLSAEIPQRDDYHHAEGNSDSHVKSSLVGVSETLLVEDGQIQLGRWQGLLFCEFDGPRTR